MSIPYLIRDNSVVVVVKGKSHNILASHPNYREIREALRTKDFAKIPDLVDIPASLATFSAGRVTVRDGVVYYGDQPMHNSLSRRILSMKMEGFDIGPMVRFMENLMLNPSKRAVDELYTFLDKNDLPITEDGHFLAYKKVRLDYKDIYTGKFDNSIGARPAMLRNQVDDVKERTCSAGLHFASLSYLPHYSGGLVGIDCRVMIVKINPKDVVSIPVDYDHAKGRCSEYEVVGEHTSQDTEKFDKSVYGAKGNSYVPPAPTPKFATATQGKDDGSQRGASAGKADGQLGLPINLSLIGVTSDRTFEYANAYNHAYREAYMAAYNKAKAPVAAPSVTLENTKYFQEFKQIIVDHLGVDPKQVTITASFESLGADSLDVVELVMAVEEEFGVDVPDSEAERMTTVGDAVRWLVKTLDPKPSTVAPVTVVPTIKSSFDQGQNDGLFHGSKNGISDALMGSSPNVFKMKANTKKTQDYVDGFNHAYVRAYVAAYRKNAKSISHTQEATLKGLERSAGIVAAPAVKLYTEGEACRALGIDRAALRKRADRGHSVKRVSNNGSVYFQILKK